MQSGWVQSGWVQSGGGAEASGCSGCSVSGAQTQPSEQGCDGAEHIRMPLRSQSLTNGSSDDVMLIEARAMSSACNYTQRTNADAIADALEHRVTPVFGRRAFRASAVHDEVVRYDR
jgi:hypothetical protein